jgi:hypothetical protein
MTRKRDRTMTRPARATARRAPTGSRDLLRLREQVRAMGEFGRWSLELIEAGIRDAGEGRAPRY